MDPNGIETPESLLWEPVEYWQKARNFTFSLVRPPDDQWGHCEGKNNSTGLLGLVIRKEVDFAIGMEVHDHKMIPSTVHGDVLFQGHLEGPEICLEMWIS